MTQTCLVLLVSDGFRKRVKGLASKHPFLIGQVTLRVLDHDEKKWQGEHGLGSEILLTLSKEQQPCVRIAAHLSSCFESGANDVFQVRFPDEEQEMKKATGIQDLQVWGFRHEPGRSPIWDAMMAIESALSESKLSENAIEHQKAMELGAQLMQAFQQATARDLYEHVTLFRHRMLGLFTALRLNLETASERASREGRVDETALGMALGKLAGKRAEALTILTEGIKELEALDIGIAPIAAEKRRAVEQVLHDLPRLERPDAASREFNGWLVRLDQTLEELRSGLI